MRTFNELLDLHREIDELFFAHQCALLHFEFENALEHLGSYETALLRHMRDEEEFLLPLYAERAEPERGGAPQIFLDDHEKMRAHIVMFRDEIRKLAEQPHQEAGMLMLLDREAFYKRLCSHHDNRESGILYPALDKITSESERSKILSRTMCKLGAV